MFNLRMLFIFYWMESSLDQDGIDVCKQELSVTETYTSLNHSNKHYIFTVLTTPFYTHTHIIILTKTCTLFDVATNVCLL